MSNWDSPWGAAEKYAYRQGIQKGRKLAEDELRNTLRSGGFNSAAEFIATGEVPLPPPIEYHHRQDLELMLRQAGYEEAAVFLATGDTPREPPKMVTHDNVARHEINKLKDRITRLENPLKPVDPFYEH